MKSKIIYSGLLILLLIMTAREVEACRFWCVIGDDIKPDVTVDQLLEAPRSLKALGETYQDGWSVGYYVNKHPIIARGMGASNVDVGFNKAVKNIAVGDTQIIFSHLRRASSGCVDGVPNPHPFERDKEGKRWIFGHNGGMRKQILIDLIGDEYLRSNLPTTCTDNAPDSWVDSELFFIFLLKHIEEQGFDVEAGLLKGLAQLYVKIPDEDRAFNFFLSDGITLWAFRKGNTLYYRDYNQEGMSIIASTVPYLDDGDWLEFPEDSIATLSLGRSIQFRLIPVEQ